MSLEDRFIKIMDTANEHKSLAPCHLCPFALKTEIIEPRIDSRKYPGLDKSFYAPVDRSTYKPKLDKPQCRGCFKDWQEMMKDKGKICANCDSWIKKPGMQVISEYEGGYKSKIAFCQDCAMKILSPVLGG